MPFFYYMDPTYILVIIAGLLSVFASFGVKGAFKKYDKVYSRRNLTGAQAARRILDSHGLTDVSVERVAGDLTDHFDPKDNVIRLSQSTYDSTSVAAVGVAAHETGHAIQYAEDYSPIKLRNSIVPAVNFSSAISLPLFFIGLIMSLPVLTNIGIILFCGVLAFQLITLPVEFNASKRAVRILDETGMLDADELTGTKKVLRAAAMTYVAAVAASALQILRLVLLANRNRRD
jgi:hypothetical protein